ncbi:murein biosynthesis integral membrane protein MurJ [Candidatus Uabimicrobium amorphum]|uniref:Probable lipid II flippase MurJ n=1 Tax=Uabimicrobium amorphum TaxID=2596890 RepID=A0A5S9IJD8_UABAM|nr:murein biosynthesis integral membrane protein MurJ [Candidatus Uabimicrobium amorphum]BBM82933.1 putative lipid II flippase MurJ [Candidatus Uabimicrobium amorphum]
MKTETQKSDKNRQVKNVSIISFFTLVSRILGLLRDILLAATFGATAILDAFVLGFTIPNFFRKLLGEGLFAAIFTPMFQRKSKEVGNEKAKIFAGVVFARLFFFTAVSSFILAALSLLCSFLPMVSHEAKLVLHLICIMLPYAIFICSTAFFSAILHAVNHFVVPALSPIILNVVWIGVLLFFMVNNVDLMSAVYIMSVSIVVTGVLQMMVQLPAMKSNNVLPKFTMNFRKNDVPFSTFLEGSVGVMVVQMNVLLDRLIAWVFITQEGAVTVLYMANRFVQFPLALIGISIATVAFPKFTAEIIQKDMQGLQRSISRALAATLLLSLPATIGLFLLSPELMAVFYGSFSTKNIFRTANVLCIYSVAVWIFCLQQVVYKVFYSFGDSKTPMKISCISVTVNVVLNFLLVNYFSELGLAAATVVSAVIALFLAVHYLKRKLQFSVIPNKLFILKVVFSTFVMGFFVYSCREKNIENLGIWHSANILSCIAMATMLYFFVFGVCNFFQRVFLRNVNNT